LAKTTGEKVKKPGSAGIYLMPGKKKSSPQSGKDPHEKLSIAIRTDETKTTARSAIW